MIFYLVLRNMSTVFRKKVVKNFFALPLLFLEVFCYNKSNYKKIYKGQGGPLQAIGFANQRSDFMGISINVGMKQDYSYLFQSLSTSSGSGLGNLNFLSDYAAIKNGSYGKLMKAYYAKDASDEVTSLANSKSKSSTSTAADDAKTLSEIKGAADGLKESADKLIDKGTDSLFKKVDIESKDESGVTTVTQGYDTEAIYSAVSDFVKDYNQMLSEGGNSETKSIQNKMNSLIGITSANENLLAKVGITVGEDNSLSVDEKKFKSADMTTVKSLFNGNQSYAYRVSAQASLIDFAAESESAKANTYTSAGSYGSTNIAGSIFDYGF